MKESDNPFSALAASYAAYRPRYPAALFAYLADIVPGHERAWDCATGSGQAALGLAAHFGAVLATDLSAAQLAHAAPHPRVHYCAVPAEASGLAAHSVDLVTVAQAIHWFDLPAFYQEVARVLRPGGVLAAWCYHAAQISPALDEIVRHYYKGVLGPYWLPGVRLVEEHYRTLPFPFDELEPPSFHGEAEWGLDELIGYLSSWSAGLAYRRARGEEPLETIRPALTAAWGSPARRGVRWPLHLRVGRVTESIK